MTSWKKLIFASRLLGERNTEDDADVDVIRELDRVRVIDGEEALRSALADSGDEAYRRGVLRLRGPRSAHDPAVA